MTPIMNADKLEYLESELENAIKEIDRQRKRYRDIGFFLRITTVVFSAAITVLLGYNLGEQQVSVTFSNIALGLGAAITVFSAIDAFFAYRSMWIQKQITWLSLRELNRSLNYYKAGIEQDMIDPQKVTQYLNDLNTIMDNDQKAWLKLREVSAPQSERDLVETD